MEILNDSKGQRIDSEKTICEVHRTIADLLEQVMPYLNDAYKMGIKLVLALIEKKIALPQWEANNIALAMKLRNERNRLVKELNETGCCL